MVLDYLDPLRRKGAWKTNLKLERSWNPSFVEEGIQHIDCHTLIIWGESDPWHPVTMAFDFNRKIPGSRIEILPACGHLPHEECPEIFSTLIFTLLKDIRW